MFVLPPYFSLSFQDLRHRLVLKQVPHSIEWTKINFICELISSVKIRSFYGLTSSLVFEHLYFVCLADPQSLNFVQIISDAFLSRFFCFGVEVRLFVLLPIFENVICGDNNLMTYCH